MRVAPVLAVLAISLAAPAAHADGLYFSEGVGGVDADGELATYMDRGLRIRIAAGMRERNWAIEGWVAAAIDVGPHHAHDGVAYRTTDPGAGDARVGASLGMYGLDLKYLQPVGAHLEGYVRGGASKAFASMALDGYEGRGLGVGAGVQLKGRVRALGFLWWPLFFAGVGPKVTASLWLDTGSEFYRLHGRAGAIDAQLGTVTFGFAVGSDL